MSAERPASVDSKELLHPRTTPEMGFQAYEEFEGDGEYRKKQGNAFIAGELYNLTLDYPNLVTADERMNQGIGKLEEILRATDTLDEERRAIIWDSASYRMAEMYFIRQAARLNRLAQVAPDSEAYHRAVADFKELNEQLYGAPDPKTVQMVLGEIWAQLDAKNFSGEARQMLEELQNGATLQIAGETIHLQPLPRAETRLPELDAELLHKLGDYLLESNSDIAELIQKYWDETVVPRERQSGKGPAFEVADMEHLFNAVNEMRDPEGVANIRIIVNKNASQLSWSTPDMAVKIGGKRLPITSVADMTAKVMHEYVVHGGRAVEGLKTDMPVLGTGLFTEADEGEDSDYLTFEEGWASLCEIAVKLVMEKKEDTEWEPMHVSRYLAIAMAYQGADSRDIYETVRRVRILMSIPDGDTVPEKVADKENRQSRINCERTLRGTPTALRSGERPPIAFTKDLGYLKGKLSGLQFLAGHIDDPEALALQFRVKDDPNNKRQLAIAQKYGSKEVA